MPDSNLEEMRRPRPDDIDKARALISALCKDPRAFRMSIPANAEDSDFLLSRVIDQAAVAVSQAELVSSLQVILGLARVKYGNLDRDANACFEHAEKLIAQATAPQPGPGIRPGDNMSGELAASVRPSIDSPLAMALRRARNKKTLVLSPRDMRELLSVQESCAKMGIGVTEVETWERKARAHGHFVMTKQYKTFMDFLETYDDVMALPDAPAARAGGSGMSSAAELRQRHGLGG